MKHKSNHDVIIAQSKSSKGLSRRDFIKRTAATGMMISIPPLLISCGGISATTDGGNETRTLFFNLAHESGASNRTYYLIGGGNQIKLTSCTSDPNVLTEARKNNAFLSAVPDDQITHFIQNAPFADSTITLCQIGSFIDANAGTWSLSMLYLNIPDNGIEYAFAHATKPLALSVKRQRYDIRPAASEQDLRDESALVDSSNHATALIMLHPALLNGEPHLAQYIYTAYTSSGSATDQLSSTLLNLGPALPATDPGMLNQSGWATLRALVNANDNQPIKSLIESNLEQIQYGPDWHPTVSQTAQAAFDVHITEVRSDPILIENLTGAKNWDRRTWPIGFNESDSTTLQIIVNNQLAGNAEGVTNFDFSGNDENIFANLNLVNWTLPYITLFLRFLDSDIPPSVIPVDSPPNTPQEQSPSTNLFPTKTASNWAIFNIPVPQESSTFTLNVPGEISRLHLAAGGLSGSNNVYPRTLVPNSIAALLTNFGLETFFYLAGGTVHFQNRGAVSFSARGFVE